MIRTSNLLHNERRLLIFQVIQAVNSAVSPGYLPPSLFDENNCSINLIKGGDGLLARISIFSLKEFISVF